MRRQRSSSRIRRLAKELDDAIERKDVESVVAAFAEDCRIELVGITLRGRAGVRRWLDWFYGKLTSVKLTAILIIIEGDTFFEEFLVEATLKNGAKITARQSEVLVYEGDKVKSLRLYFDRLEFAEAVAHDPVSRSLVKKIVALSLAGLD
jgi:ketosteroid isomerase-like protein